MVRGMVRGTVGGMVSGMLMSLERVASNCSVLHLESILLVHILLGGADA